MASYHHRGWPRCQTDPSLREFWAPTAVNALLAYSCLNSAANVPFGRLLSVLLVVVISLFVILRQDLVVKLGVVLNSQPPCLSLQCARILFFIYSSAVGYCKSA